MDDRIFNQRLKEERRQFQSQILLNIIMDLKAFSETGLFNLQIGFDMTDLRLQGNGSAA